MTKSVDKIIGDDITMISQDKWMEKDQTKRQLKESPQSEPCDPKEWIYIDILKSIPHTTLHT